MLIVLLLTLAHAFPDIFFFVRMNILMDHFFYKFLTQANLSFGKIFSNLFLIMDAFSSKGGTFFFLTYFLLSCV